ncbi:uncharacterized protein LOC126892213 isoform X1 [Diabrotica virgifera virgifera]|uniref:DDE-1 domain-containing protein n=1 Tax=Diabrotica virgifera virgifera TaxID=50390 RepID=A0ABM5L5G1_DIAVI|nr:uncharacterized protein LOC126892213 isoform X1 [Diabrotica virgifera virgifera]
MDNHHSHICIEVINLAKENGVTIVTLPPHCSGKLQPLDVSCYAPFKTYYAAAVDSWQKQNPGKVFSIYNIAGCVNEAHQKTMIPTTIVNGFRKTGIFAYNRDLFTEADYMSSFVTDRPDPEHSTEIDLTDPPLLAGPSSQSNEEPSLHKSQHVLQNTSEMKTIDNKTFRSLAEFKA